MKSHWLIIGPISWATRVLFRKPKPWNVFSTCSSRSFSFRLNIEILIHLELTLVQGEREDQFHPCTCRYPVVPTPFVKDDSFSIMYLFGFLSKPWWLLCLDLRLGHQFSFLNQHVCVSSTLLFWLLWLRSIIWNQEQWHLQQCFIVHDCLGYLGSFVFPFEF